LKNCVGVMGRGNLGSVYLFGIIFRPLTSRPIRVVKSFNDSHALSATPDLPEPCP
jgi:hypothetical protein